MLNETPQETNTSGTAGQESSTPIVHESKSMHHRISIIDTINNLGIDHILRFGRNPIRIFEQIQTGIEFHDQQSQYFADAMKTQKDLTSSQIYFYSLRIKYEQYPILLINCFEEISDQEMKSRREKAKKVWELFNPVLIEDSYRIASRTLMTTFINLHLQDQQKQQQR